MKLSARNQIKGRITAVVEGQTTGHVHIGGGVTIHSSITNKAIDDLQLKVGDDAMAVVKSSDVMIASRGRPMRAGWIAPTGVVVFAALLGIGGTPSRAADPAPAAVASPAAGAGIVVSGRGQDMTMTAAALALLPMVQVPVPAGTAPGARERTFEGPLLWTVLAHAGAVDRAKHQADVRGTVLLTLSLA